MNFCTDRWISRPTSGIMVEGQGQGERREEIVQGRDVAEAFCKRISSSVSASSPITICTSCGECADVKN